jgi:hypothetical protein
MQEASAFNRLSNLGDEGDMNFRGFMTPLAAVGFALFSATASIAAPVHYDEAASGDINGIPFMFLDIGTNTVHGTSLFVHNSSGSNDADLDSFPFIVPDGGVLKSISFAFSVTQQIPNTITLFVQYRLEGDGFPPPALEFGPEIQFLTGTSPVELFESTLPLSEGFYRMSIQTIGAGGPNLGTTFGGEWAYTFTFDVAQVPEPGSMSLFATALALCAMARWRRGRA